MEQCGECDQWKATDCGTCGNCQGEGPRATREEGISPIVKDDHHSGITGGFSTGVPNQVRLFIRNEQLDTAKTMINEYFTEVGEPLL